MPYPTAPLPALGQELLRFLNKVSQKKVAQPWFTFHIFLGGIAIFRNKRGWNEEIMAAIIQAYFSEKLAGNRNPDIHYFLHILANKVLNINAGTLPRIIRLITSQAFYDIVLKNDPLAFIFWINFIAWLNMLAQEQNIVLTDPHENPIALTAMHMFQLLKQLPDSPEIKLDLAELKKDFLIVCFEEELLAMAGTHLKNRVTYYQCIFPQMKNMVTLSAWIEKLKSRISQVPDECLSLANMIESMCHDVFSEHFTTLAPDEGLTLTNMMESMCHDVFSEHFATPLLRKKSFPKTNQLQFLQAFLMADAGLLECKIQRFLNAKPETLQKLHTDFTKEYGPQATFKPQIFGIDALRDLKYFLFVWQTALLMIIFEKSKVTMRLSNLKAVLEPSVYQLYESCYSILDQVISHRLVSITHPSVEAIAMPAETSKRLSVILLPAIEKAPEKQGPLVLPKSPAALEKMWLLRKIDAQRQEKLRQAIKKRGFDPEEDQYLSKLLDDPKDTKFAASGKLVFEKI